IHSLPVPHAPSRAATLDPLGFLPPAARRTAVADDDCESALGPIRQEGTSARPIGSLGAWQAQPTVPPQNEVMVIMEGKHGRRPLPHFPQDEVARFLAQPDE